MMLIKDEGNDDGHDPSHRSTTSSPHPHYPSLPYPTPTTHLPYPTPLPYPTLPYPHYPILTLLPYPHNPHTLLMIYTHHLRPPQPGGTMHGERHPPHPGTRMRKTDPNRRSKPVTPSSRLPLRTGARAR